MPELSRAQVVVYGAIAVALLLVGARAIRSEGGTEQSFAAGSAGAAPPPARLLGGGFTLSGQAGDLVVDVTGAVARPGVYRLPAGSRVDDAMRARRGRRRRGPSWKPSTSPPGSPTGSRWWCPSAAPGGSAAGVAARRRRRADQPRHRHRRAARHDRRHRPGHRAGHRRVPRPARRPRLGRPARPGLRDRAGDDGVAAGSAAALRRPRALAAPTAAGPARDRAPWSRSRWRAAARSASGPRTAWVAGCRPVRPSWRAASCSARTRTSTRGPRKTSAAPGSATCSRSAVRT